MHSSRLGNVELCLKENSPVHSARREKKKQTQNTTLLYNVLISEKLQELKRESDNKLIKIQNLTYIIFLPVYIFSLPLSENETATHRSYLWFQVHQTDSFVIHLKNHILSPHFAFGIQQFQLPYSIIHCNHCLFSVQNKGSQVLVNGMYI